MPDSLPDLDARSPISSQTRRPAVDPTVPGTSRRAVLNGVAGFGAVAAAAAVGAGTSLSNPLGEVAPVAALLPADATLVAHVRPGSPDQVTLYSGEREVSVTDRALVQALLAALGTR